MNNLKNSIFGSYCDIETREEITVSLNFEHFYFPTNEDPDKVVKSNLVRDRGGISHVYTYMRKQDNPNLAVIEFRHHDGNITKIYLEASIMDALATSWVEFANKSQEDATDSNDERVFVDEQSRIIIGSDGFFDQQEKALFILLQPHSENNNE